MTLSKYKKKSKYSKQEVILELQAVAKKLGRAPYGTEFDKNAIFHHHVPARIFGTWNEALQAASLKPRLITHYDKKSLIKALRQKYKELGRPVTHYDMKSPSYMTYHSVFGSWNNALRKAGLPIVQEMDYSEKFLLDKLRKLGNKVGRTPSEKDVRIHKITPDVGVYQRYFGSWNNATEKAGFEPVVQRHWSNEEIICAIKAFKCRTGRTPTGEECKDDDNLPNKTSIHKHFGSFNNAIKLAGLKTNDGRMGEIWKRWQTHCENLARVIYGEILRQHSFDKDVKPDIFIPSKNLIIEAQTSAYLDERKQKRLIRYAKHYPVQIWCIHKGKELRINNVKYIYADELQQLIKSKAPSLAKRTQDFYKFNDSIREEIGTWTSKELIALLKRVGKKYGKTPTEEMLRKEGNRPTHKVFKAVFGSFPNARKQAGFKEVLRYEKVTKEELIQQLRSLANRLGKIPSGTDIDKDKQIATSPTIRKYFGSLPAAIKAAGLENFKSKILHRHKICKLCKKKYKITAITLKRLNYLCAHRRYCSRKCNLTSLKHFN